MNPIVKNILAVLVAIIVGMAVNMSLIMISSSVIAPPEGADLTTVEGLKAAMPRMGPQHFIMPFLAHAFGTFIAALIAARLVAQHHKSYAMAMGVLFLIGGLINIFLLPAPMWFNVLDLLGAYLPMAYLGAKLGMKK